jgi:chromosome partitioning protein
VLLLDFDAQGSSTHWLSRRDERLPRVHGVEAYRKPTGMTRSWYLRVPDGVQRVVIDTPAAADTAQVLELLGLADTLVIPVLPSEIDIHALTRFLEVLLLRGKVRARPLKVGIVANRVRHNTRVFLGLERFLSQVEFPFVARLRESRNYTAAVEQGVGIHHLAPFRTRPDRQEWSRLLEWVDEPRSGDDTVYRRA